MWRGSFVTRVGDFRTWHNNLNTSSPKCYKHLNSPFSMGNSKQLQNPFDGKSYADKIIIYIEKPHSQQPNFQVEKLQQPSANENKILIPQLPEKITTIECRSVNSIFCMLNDYHGTRERV